MVVAPLRTILLKLEQLHLIPQYRVHKWEKERRAFRGPIRPAINHSRAESSMNHARALNAKHKVDKHQ